MQRRTHETEPVRRGQPAPADAIKHAQAAAAAVAPARAGLALHVEAIRERDAHHGVLEPRLPAPEARVCHCAQSVSTG